MTIHNQKITIAATTTLVVLITNVFIYFFLEKNKPNDDSSLEDKVLRFSYTLTNTSADFIPEVELFSYLPVTLPNTQNIKSITSSHDYEIVDDDDLHQSIKFTIQNFPPYGSRIVNLTLELQTSPLPHQERIKSTVFLKDEKYIETNSEIVKALADTLGEDDFPEKSIYQWLVNNLKDVGYVAENKGAKFALEQRIGDCTEHMYAFIALARAKGIPARGFAGFVVENPAQILTSSSYHNWAEFYDGKKWILVDSQRRVFNDKYQHYIPFRIFGGDSTDALASTNRFLTTDSRISINL